MAWAAIADKATEATIKTEAKSLFIPSLRSWGCRGGFVISALPLSFTSKNEFRKRELNVRFVISRHFSGDASEQPRTN
jgi:hypothetical protein